MFGLEKAGGAENAVQLYLNDQFDKEAIIHSDLFLCAFGNGADMIIYDDCNIRRSNMLNIGQSYGEETISSRDPNPLGNFSSYSYYTHPEFRVEEIEVYAVKGSRDLSNPQHWVNKLVDTTTKLSDKLVVALCRTLPKFEMKVNELERSFLREAQMVHQLVRFNSLCTAAIEGDEVISRKRRRSPPAEAAGSSRLSSSSTSDAAVQSPPPELECVSCELAAVAPCTLCQIETVIRNVEASASTCLMVDIVYFNVMGEIMSIRRASITKAAPLSALAARVSGRWTEQERDLDDKGNILIEEPIECFRALLAYMRLRALRLELEGEAEGSEADGIYVSAVWEESMNRLLNYQTMDVPVYVIDSDT
jgi:hypothetical protein